MPASHLPELYREHPFERSVKAERMLEELPGDRDFKHLMDPG
jgi:hypothetical protein